MVLRLKARESRSLPGLPNALGILFKTPSFPDDVRSDLQIPLVAGWSSPVARQAHNLKVVGSNPAPAPKYLDRLVYAGLFAFWGSQRPAWGSKGFTSLVRPSPASPALSR